MKKYWLYLKYLLRHKWFVLLECWKVGLYWRGITHDLSKFSAIEFLAYAEFFYGVKNTAKKNQRDKTGYYKPTDTGDPEFDAAWRHHAHLNDHHWQFWVLNWDCWEEGTTPRFPPVHVSEMPPAARLEMICDWKGAGRAQGKVGKDGKPEIVAWYEANGRKMLLGPQTRNWVDNYIKMER